MKRLIYVMTVFCLALGVSGAVFGADEELKRDRRSNPVVGAVTDDANKDIKMLRVDPATGELLTKTTAALAAGAATELKQDDQIAQLVAILAKLLAAPSTEAKQDDMITELVAILAKISADPSTASLQTSGNASLTSIDGKTPALGETTKSGSVPVVRPSDDGTYDVESPHFTLDSADATTGWTVVGDAANIATSTTHLEGTLALEWDKAGGTEVTSGIQKTIDTAQTPGHVTDVLLNAMLFIKDGTDLATVDFAWLRIGEDSSNYLEFQTPGVDLAILWNQKSVAMALPTSQTGAGLSSATIKYVAIGVVTNNAADTFTNMLIDDLHYDEVLSAAVVAAPSSDFDLGVIRLQDGNSGRKVDVEMDGSNKAMHVMSNSMASESTLSTMDAKFVTGTDIGDVTINNAAGGSGVFTQGQAADGAAVAGNPVRMAGKNAAGLTQDLAIASNGILPFSTPRTTTTDGVANNLRGLMIDVDGASVIYHSWPMLFNNVTWDRMRGNTFGLFAQGPAADGAAVSGNPVRIAGKSSAGNTEDIATSPNGELALVNKGTGADGFSNARLGSLLARTGESQYLQIASAVFNGTSWDRMRGDLTDGLLSNLGANNDVTITPGQTAAEPTVIAVGDTPTLIFAASSTTESVTMQNAGTAIIFLGKSGVTTLTGIGIRGGVVNNDMKGQTAKASHGDDIYGIVASGTVNLRIQPVSK